MESQLKICRYLHLYRKCTSLIRDNNSYKNGATTTELQEMLGHRSMTS